jgi:FtsH-binding integral membrane protein
MEGGKLMRETRDILLVLVAVIIIMTIFVISEQWKFASWAISALLLVTWVFWELLAPSRDR